MACQRLRHEVQQPAGRRLAAQFLPRATQHGLTFQPIALAMGTVDEDVAQRRVHIGHAKRQVVGDGAQELLALFSLRQRARHGSLRVLAVGDVADQRHPQGLALARGLGDGDVDRKFAAVLAPACAFGAQITQRPGQRFGSRWRPKTRHQLRHMPAHERDRFVAEHCRTGPVGRLDQAVGAQRQDAVGRVVNDGCRAPCRFRQRGLGGFAPGMCARHGYCTGEQRAADHRQQHRVPDCTRPPVGQRIGHRHPHRHHQRVFAQRPVAVDALGLVAHHHLLHGAHGRGRQVLLEHRRVNPVAGVEGFVARGVGQHPAVRQKQRDEAVAAGVNGVQHRLQRGRVHQRHQGAGKTAVGGQQAARDGQAPPQWRRAFQPAIGGVQRRLLAQAREPVPVCQRAGQAGCKHQGRQAGFTFGVEPHQAAHQAVVGQQGLQFQLQGLQAGLACRFTVHKPGCGVGEIDAAHTIVQQGLHAAQGLARVLLQQPRQVGRVAVLLLHRTFAFPVRVLRRKAHQCQASDAGKQVGLQSGLDVHAWPSIGDGLSTPMPSAQAAVLQRARRPSEALRCGQSPHCAYTQETPCTPPPAPDQLRL